MFNLFTLRWTRRKFFIFFVLFILTLNIIFGGFAHLFEESFETNFHYPYDGDVYGLVQQLRNNLTPNVPPINSYNYKFLKNCQNKCENSERIRLVYLIKSKPDNFKQRIAIRNSWGFEKRFSDVPIRRIFLLGIRDDPKLQNDIDNEHKMHGDIVQANFKDSYFNNTIKTMIGLKWAMRYCPTSKFYMFVDDDFYVSTKNVLRFVRNPTNYPTYLQKPFDNLKNVLLRSLKQLIDFELPDDVKLYAGYVFNSSPHRHLISKWYITLEEYPYDMWPPYVTAGSVLLSKDALMNMYFASFYTKNFRFDDIYLALLALKMNIEPFHCDEFYFYKKPYNPKDYAYTIASHGYNDPDELTRVWSQQKTLGNA